MSSTSSFNINRMENINNFKSKRLEQNYFTGDEVLTTEVNISIFEKRKLKG